MQLKILEYEATTAGICKRKAKTKKRALIEDMNARMTELDATFDHLVLYFNQVSSISIRSNSTEYNAQDLLNLIKLKNYLQWIINQLRQIQHAKSNSKLHLLNQKCIALTESEIQSFDILLNDYFKFNGRYIYDLRNRAGRGAEHVGIVLKSMDFGTLLQSGLNALECRLYDTGLYFSREEVLTILTTKEPNFQSHAMVASFCVFYLSLNDPGFLTMFKKSYYEACKSIYQVYNEVSFVNLKSLMVLTSLTFYESDTALLKKISMPLLNMAYSLGLNKRIENRLLVDQNEDVELYLHKRITWNCIRAFFVTNNMLLSSLPSVGDFEVKGLEFEQLRALIQSHSVDTWLLNFLDCFRIQLHEIVIVLSNHMKNIKRSYKQLEVITYHQARLPIEIYNKMQNTLKVYFIPSIRFLRKELNEMNQGSITITKYFCQFKNQGCKIHPTFHQFKESVLIYYLQIILIYPLINYHPQPIDLTTEELLILSEAAIRMFHLLQANTFIYLNQVYLSSSQNHNEKSFQQLKEYLATCFPPIATDEFEAMIYLNVASLQFDCYLYPLFTFLLLLSSNQSCLLSDISKEYKQNIKHKIIQILKVLKIINHIKNPKAQFDITHVIDKILKFSKYFPLQQEDGIEWEEYLN
ncbi:hypothetical protein K502DRAFT_329099 [Neoconidiobolus thromboides FSU 785]|nr:hypothetical protein K502DRAFT_329099 [Neoconidiobolus thromboides FSU 785]